MYEDQKIKYLGFGSPLMDMIADVDEEFIIKYDLKLDTTIHQKMSETKVFNAIEKETSVTYVPGGCSYNAMRVFNWMLVTKEGKREDGDKTGLLGSVGDDFYGELYASLLTKESIVPLFEKVDKLNTGVCVVFCHNRDRGHITDLGASVMVSKEFVQRIWEELRDVELIYTELFILKHRKEIVYLLAEHALNDKRIFGFNLPSHYFIETYFEDIKTLWEYSDVAFANAAEAILFGHLLGIQTAEDDLGELVQTFAKLPKKNKNKKRTVVITSGPNPAHIAQYDFIKEELTYFSNFAPEPVDENLIIDTNGAGDAFAGGFLSQFVKKQPLEKCMHAGHWAASLIIQTRGCKISEDLIYQYEEL